jgi:hypothetical protein
LVIKLQKKITLALLFDLIASAIHFTNKLGIIEVYKSQKVKIITSDFSIALIAFEFASTLGVK